MVRTAEQKVERLATRLGGDTCDLRAWHAQRLCQRAKVMTGIAAETGLSREGLYRSLSSEGRPELATAMKVLDAFDMQLVVKPKNAA